MMRVCHLNTCPVGVATQDPRLREKFSGDPNYVVNFMRFVAEEVREFMAELGFRNLNEMVGRTDILETDPASNYSKAGHLDLSPILFQPDVPAEYGRFQQFKQDHKLEQTLDKSILLEMCRPALESGEHVSAELEIHNTDRAVGTLLGSEISRKYGAAGLPDETIRLNFTGSAGQSFGAFLPSGVTLTLEGDSNDYVGKGLSDGKIVVFPPKTATFPSHENVIIGNTALYGATSGTAFIAGVAGERFAVRNSGANAVVEGIGDHGCEYMTGGRVVVLGQTGKNFAAGMSGGIAYVFDETADFWRLCNTEMVSLSQIEKTGEIEFVKGLIAAHFESTGSQRAKEILGNWDANLAKFVRVIPVDYEQVTETQKRLISSGLSPEKAAMRAFVEKVTA